MTNALAVDYKQYKLSSDASIVLNAKGNMAHAYQRREKKVWFLNKDTYVLIYLLNQNLSMDQIFKRIPSGSLKDNFIFNSTQIITDLLNKNILIEGNSNKLGLIRQEKFSPALKSIQLEITRRCNLRCKHCYLNDYSGKDELTTAEVFNLIDEAAEMGVHEIHITGGEPLVRKDLKKVIERIYEKGMYGKLYTNGILINDEIVDFLKHIGIEAVKISLDGFKPKTHDDLRRATNGFENTINNIHKLNEAGIPVEVGSVITKGNVNEVKPLINYFKNELKVKYHIDSFVPIGQGVESAKGLYLSDEEYIDALKDEFGEALKVKESPKKDQKKKQEFFCGAGNSYVFINANGLVKFCPTMPDKLSGGNIREKSLEKVWLDSPFFNSVRNINCKYIEECPHASSCRGGCRSRSLLKYGAIDEPDLQMCKMFFVTTGIKAPGLIANEEKVNA